MSRRRLNGAFALSRETRWCMVFRHRGKSYSRCRFIVHIADYELSQIKRDMAVGADLSRPPPIYRPAGTPPYTPIYLLIFIISDVHDKSLTCPPDRVPTLSPGI